MQPRCLPLLLLSIATAVSAAEIGGTFPWRTLQAEEAATNAERLKPSRRAGDFAAECVGKKASDLVEVTKLKMEAAEVEKDVSATLEGLGRLVYDGRKSGQDVSALTEECITKIDELNARVAELRRKIDEYNNILRCPQCQAVNTDDSLYCKKCGTKLGG